jgi:hypothetical protein
MRSLGRILRSWHRYHILLLEEPAKGHLTRSLAVAITDSLQQCHNRPQRVELRAAERFPKAPDANKPAASEICGEINVTSFRFSRTDRNEDEIYGHHTLEPRSALRTRH